ITGAEARYLVAAQQLKAKQYDKAIESAFDISNTFSSYDYWVAKGFILMADAYAAKGDKFQAKTTLESIIDNYEDETDGVIKEAKARLEKLKQHEHYMKLHKTEFRNYAVVASLLGLGGEAYAQPEPEKPVTIDS